MAEGIYVYAIIPAAEEPTFDVAGVEGPDGAPYTIAREGVAAVVGPSRRADYRGMTREESVRALLGHQRVVEAVMDRFPVLPVKFGTVLANESLVRGMLGQGKELFRTAFERLAGRVQMEVVALWHVQDVFDEIAEEEPIVRLKSELARRPAEEMTSERVALGRMVKASLDRRRREVEAILLSSLGEAASDLVVNALMDDSMVANAALLVDANGRYALEQRLTALDERFEGRLHLRCIGPLPPYSFATVTVARPPFEAIDGARRRLGLGHKVQAEELKRAYRELAKSRHPDCQGEDAEAAARMAELTQDWALLDAYVRGYRSGGGAAADRAAGLGCDLSRETVESTLLIAVRRQEMRAQGAVRT